MKTSTWQFTRHYLEMVLAMFAGMIVLGLPAEGALHLVGSSSSDLKEDAPTLLFIGMALIMTIPMVWLMRRHGHAWRLCWEMAASMFIPTFGVIAVMAAGISDDFGALMTNDGSASACTGARQRRVARWSPSRTGRRWSRRR